MFDAYHRVDDKIYEKENTWTFGQMVPVLFLLTPVLLVCEGLSGGLNSQDCMF